MNDNPMFAKFDSVLGMKTPTTSGAPVSTWADSLRALGKAPEKPPAATDTANGSLASRISATGNDMGQKLGQGMSEEEMAGVDQAKQGIKEGAEGYQAGVEQANNAKTLGEAAMGEVKATGSLLHSAAQSVIGAGRAIFAPITSAVKVAIDKVSDNPEIQKLANTPAIRAWLDSADQSAATMEKLAEEHPTLAKVIGDVVGVGALALGGEGEAAVGSDLKSVTKGIGSDVVSGTKALAKKIPSVDYSGIGAEKGGLGEALTPKPDVAGDLQKISEKIMPKPTVREAKLATEQGRLFKGKAPGLFTEGGPDKVAMTEQQAASGRTVYRLIPDAAKMSDPDLVFSINEKVGQISRDLKPEMQKVPVSKTTVGNITKEWESVKAAQKEDAYIPSDVNVKKLQADFEKRLQNSKSGSMNDLWETRQAYDDSVPDSVKNANQMSSESLQAKKDIWLQNRRVLTNAINDTESGLGDTSKNAFKDMRDLYEAKNGILSKAKIETTGALSKIQQFGKSKTGKVIKTAAKVAGAGYVGDKIIKGVTGIGF